MTSWKSDEELAKDSRASLGDLQNAIIVTHTGDLIGVFVNVIFVFFGIFIWEFATTWDFELSIITRKRKFTWPLSESAHCFRLVEACALRFFPEVFYFLCRYCMLLALVGLVLSLSVTKEINCNALYIFNSVTGNLAILNASTSLMIRTIALWERKWAVVIPLGIMCLAHWAILWRGMFIVDANWNPEQGACVVTSTQHVFLNVGFFTTMGVDFTVMCFSMFALLRKHHTKSDLWNLLFRDGLVYFVITFACNAVPAILNVLDLNPIMNVYAYSLPLCNFHQAHDQGFRMIQNYNCKLSRTFTVFPCSTLTPFYVQIPAATVAAIAACRLVVRLQVFNKADVYIHETPVTSERRRSLRFSSMASKRHTMPRRPEVVVTTDHFVMEDFSLPSSPKSMPLSPVSLDEKVEATLRLKSSPRKSTSTKYDDEGSGTDTGADEAEKMV